MSHLSLEELELIDEPKYRNYINGVDKTLKNFEYTSEWADLISALGKLNKVITRAGAYYRYGERQWQGADAMLASIREEIDLKEALERDVLDSIKAGSKFAYEE